MAKHRRILRFGDFLVGVGKDTHPGAIALRDHHLSPRGNLCQPSGTGIRGHIKVGIANDGRLGAKAGSWRFRRGNRLNGEEQEG